MRIAYLINELPGAATAMNCKKVFVDTEKTDKQELDYMLNKGGIVSGDTVCVRQISDFGRGKQGARIAAQIHDMGAEIEYHPAKAKRDRRGRPSVIDPSDLSDDQFSKMQTVWHKGLYGTTRTLERLTEIAKQPVSKSQAYTLFGNRRDEPKKRKAVA